MRGKQSGSSQPERSNFRVLYIDGDLAGGEIQNMTNALIAAIRPTQVTMRSAPPRRLANPSAEVDGNGTGQTDLGLDETEVNEIAEVADDEAPAPKSGRGRPRTYRKPEPVDIDLKAGEKPWAEFAKDKGPKAHRGRYLVAAAWLHDALSLKTITADHVFTCYKGAGWNFNIGDPTVTFRTLKSEGLGGLKEGSFTINHLGLAQVEEMKSAP